MNSKSSLLKLTFVASAVVSILPAMGAPFPAAPPVPSLAPKAGMATELFNGVKLASRPVNNAPVEGWYPLAFADFTEFEEGEIPDLELPPAIFDAPAGVLRLAPPSGSDIPIGGRSRQIPASTEVSIDFFVENRHDSAISLVGVAGSFSDATYRQDGLFYGQYGFYLVNLPFGVAGEIQEADEDQEAQWYALVPGAERPILLVSDLTDQWVRLEIKVNEENHTISYLVNGKTVHTGPFYGIDEEQVLQVAVPITEVTLFAFAAASIFESSSTEGPAEIDEEVVQQLFFFDNLSFNGAGGSADLTIGIKRPSASHSGNNVYGPADKQTVKIEQRFNRRAAAWFSLQNDGASVDEFSLSSKRRGSSQVRVKNFAMEGSKRVNVTGAIAAGSFKAVIDPGKEISLLSEARLTGRAKKTLAKQRGKTLSSGQTLRATATVNPTASDAARADFTFNSPLPRSRGGY